METLLVSLIWGRKINHYFCGGSGSQNAGVGRSLAMKKSLHQPCQESTYWPTRMPRGFRQAEPQILSSFLCRNSWRKITPLKNHVHLIPQSSLRHFWSQRYMFQNIISINYKTVSGLVGSCSICKLSVSTRDQICCQRTKKYRDSVKMVTLKSHRSML